MLLCLNTKLICILNISIVFNDFGNEFQVIDATGENPVTGMVAAITKEVDGIVTCLDESTDSTRPPMITRSWAS